MEVYAYHQLMIAQSAVDHVEISSHTQGNTLAVETNSRFIGTDLREGTFLSMVGWE
jgi:hypothetical protein